MVAGPRRTDRFRGLGEQLMRVSPLAVSVAYPPTGRAPSPPPGRGHRPGRVLGCGSGVRFGPGEGAAVGGPEDDLVRHRVELPPVGSGIGAQPGECLLRG